MGASPLTPLLQRGEVGKLGPPPDLPEGRSTKCTVGTVPIVHFFVKKIAELLGSFGNFLYLCNILKSGIQATRCSWSEGVSNTIKNTTKGMIELYLSKVTENSETEQAGKLYARVSYKETMSVQDMAHHMAEHNTMFSEGSITGILIDFVKCVREQVLMGNTVKIDNLAIFKATVEANALETLYDAQSDKVAQASIGVLAEGQKTGPAVKTIKLLAQSTGDFTRDELKKDAKLSWTDKTKAEIAAAKGTTDSTDGTNSGGNNQSGGSGTLTPGGNNSGGGDNSGDGDDH